MLECKAKQDSIFEKLNTIVVSLIFWVIATFLIPIVSLVLRLYLKESKIKKDLTQDNLQDSRNKIDFFN
tara:strand:+ start:487 stop:693 length:207 start_codon:yes stop_codon:yes gene_type:complete